MIIRCLLLCFSLFLGSILSAQQITLKGKILNKVDAENIHILNISSSYNTISNSKGEFLINVAMNDTLLFSSLQYELEERIITKKIYQEQNIEITLQEKVNQLDEVVIGPRLSGNLESDLKNIKTKDPINFDDVGIPGFKGKPQEKIVPAVIATMPTSVNIEALYKHISGYYRKLKTKRKWIAENHTIIAILNTYGVSFFEEAYKIPPNRVYDFLLFCIETTTLKPDFDKQNFAGVITIFKEQAAIYIVRFSIEK